MCVRTMDMDTATMKFWLGLLCLLYSVGGSNPRSCEDIQNPSLGDLCVESENLTTTPGVVLIYYTDNVEPPQWGAICAGASDHTLDVMCRQLRFGLAKRDIPQKPNYNKKKWFKDIDCQQDMSRSIQHVLRCPITLYTADENCSSVVQLQCEGEKEVRPPDPYDGQVFLVSPDNATEPGQQVSLGLVLIYISNQSWGGITQDTEHPLSSNAADSICRQLGYTQADPRSITTKEHSPLQNFPLPEDEKVSWLTSSAVNECLNSSEACFTCCFNQTTKCDSSSATCPEGNDVVLQCLFDSHTNIAIASEGSGSLCSLDNLPGHCSSKSQNIAAATIPTFERLTIGFGVALGVTILALLISIVINVVLYCKRRPVLPEQQRLLRDRPNNLDGLQN